MYVHESTAPRRMQREQLQRLPVLISGLRNEKRTRPQWQRALYSMISPPLQKKPASVPERRIRQDDRRLDLTIRYCPVRPQQLGLALRRDELEVVALVKADRPCGGGPGAHEHASRAQVTKMLDQYSADAVPLITGKNIGVTDQIDVAYGLNAHHAYERPVPLVAPESNSAGDFGIQLL